MSDSFGGWSDPPEASPPTSRFGSPATRYRIDGPLGEGGMGEVYRAWDLWLQREVALKRVHSRLGADALRERLLREARVTAQLDHPGIVAVLDVGDADDGRLFYTMRLIRGRTLDAALTGMSRAERLRHLVEALRAVAFAHVHGVMHRDLKPNNIMVGELGETQVVDWGLARAVDDPDVHADLELVGVSSPHLTRVGAVLGTDRYLSPEAAEGRSGIAGDVYALGVVLIEVLVEEQASSPTGWRELATRLGDPVLTAIALRALHDTTEVRYPHAKAMLEDLSAYVEDRAVTAYSDSTWERLARFRRRHRWPIRLGLTALITALTILTVAAIRVVQERDRALEAESVAERARHQADDTLASTLTRQAEDALKRNNIGEAEVLASHAFDLRGRARARGILMATGAWTGTIQPSLPPCDGDYLTNRGGWICRDEALAKAPPADIDALSDSTMMGSPTGLWIATRDQRLVHLGLRGDIVQTRGGAAALVVNESMAARYQLDRAHVLSVDGRAQEVLYCDGTMHADLVLLGESAWVVCGDGRIGTFTADSPVTYLARLPDVTNIKAIARAPDALLVARGDRIERLDPSTGEVFNVIEPQAGIIRRMTVDDSGRWALVFGGDTTPTVVDTRAGAAVLRLPSSWTGPHLGGDAVLRTGGRTPIALPVGPSLVTHFDTDSGISDFDVSPRNGDLAVGYGDGRVRVWSWLDGDLRFARQLNPKRVTKSLVYDANDDTLWVNNFADPAPRRIDPLTGEDQTPTFSPWNEQCRRLLSLRGGGPWCATYGHVFPFRPEDRDRLNDAVHIDGDQSSPDIGVFVDENGLIWTVHPDGSRRNVATIPGTGRITIDGTGAHMAVTSDDHITVLSADASVLHTLTPLPSGLQEIRLSADGEWLAASGIDSVLVWRVSDGALVADLPDLHRERVSGLLFTETSLITGSWDGSVRRWSLAPLLLPIAPTHAESRWAITLADIVD